MERNRRTKAPRRDSKDRIRGFYNGRRDEIEPRSTGPVYLKRNVDEDQNQYVRYASQISNNDLDFISTLNAENGLFSPDRKHEWGSYICQANNASNGQRTYDWGFCGINTCYNPEIRNDPRFLEDPQWQLDQCYRLYQEWPERYHGYKKREAQKKHFYLAS